MRSVAWTTFMPVERWSSSTMRPLRVGSRCWMITKATPLSGGTLERNPSRASSPPAEAPIPTTTGGAFLLGAALFPVPEAFGVPPPFAFFIAMAIPFLAIQSSWPHGPPSVSSERKLLALLTYSPTHLLTALRGSPSKPKAASR